MVMLKTAVVSQSAFSILLGQPRPAGAGPVGVGVGGSNGNIVNQILADLEQEKSSNSHSVYRTYHQGSTIKKCYSLLKNK